MAFAQKAPLVRSHRAISGGDLALGSPVSHHRPSPPSSTHSDDERLPPPPPPRSPPASAQISPPPHQQAPLFSYAPLVMAHDGTQLFSLTDASRPSHDRTGSGAAGTAELLPPPSSSVAGSAVGPDSDTELDVLALEPSALDSSSWAGGSFAFVPPRSGGPLPSPSHAQDDTYSSISEIFSPPALSASEQEQDPAHSSDMDRALAEALRDMSPRTGFHDATVDRSGAEMGTGGWPRWAAARSAWAEASAAAAHARRPSVISLLSSTDDQPPPRPQLRSSRTHISRTPADPSVDRALSPPGQESPVDTWSSVSIRPSRGSDTDTNRGTRSSRGLAILDELDLFDDEIQAARRGNASPANVPSRDNFSSHTPVNVTSSPRAGRTAHFDQDETMDAVTPKRLQSAAPSRTPSLLHLPNAVPDPYTSHVTPRRSPAPDGGLTSHMRRPSPLTSPAAGTPSKGMSPSQQSPLLRPKAVRTTIAAEDRAEEWLDRLLATAPSAESAGLHMPCKHGMKRTRRAPALGQSYKDRQQNQREASRVWSRLHGDYGRFNDGDTDATAGQAPTYSSDSELSSVEAGRGSKRSNASVSTTTTTRVRLSRARKPSTGANRLRSRGRGDASVKTYTRSAYQERVSDRPPGPRSLPEMTQSSQRAAPYSADSPASASRTSITESKPPRSSSPSGIVNALWRKVFAVDEDVMRAFMAADPVAGHLSSKSTLASVAAATPLGLGRRPFPRLNFGDDDPDALPISGRGDGLADEIAGAPIFPVGKEPGIEQLNAPLHQGGKLRSQLSTQSMPQKDLNSDVTSNEVAALRSNEQSHADSTGAGPLSLGQSAPTGYASSSHPATAVLDYMIPLPLLGQLETLANAARTHRARYAQDQYGDQAFAAGDGSHAHTHAHNRARTAYPSAPPLEPSTGEALQALLGSVGTQLESHVSRHFFFLSFAGRWIARALPWSAMSSAPDTLRRASSASGASAGTGLEEESATKLTRPPLSPVVRRAATTQSRRGSSQRRSWSSLSSSSLDTTARYQFGMDVPASASAPHGRVSSMPA